MKLDILFIITFSVLNLTHRCYEADIALGLELEFKHSNLYMQLGFRSCNKWNEINSLLNECSRSLLLAVKAQQLELLYRN